MDVGLRHVPMAEGHYRLRALRLAEIQAQATCCRATRRYTEVTDLVERLRRVVTHGGHVTDSDAELAAAAIESLISELAAERRISLMHATQKDAMRAALELIKRCAKGSETYAAVHHPNLVGDFSTIIMHCDSALAGSRLAQTSPLCPYHKTGCDGPGGQIRCDGCRDDMRRAPLAQDAGRSEWRDRKTGKPTLSDPLDER